MILHTQYANFRCAFDLPRQGALNSAIATLETPLLVASSSTTVGISGMALYVLCTAGLSCWTH